MLYNSSLLFSVFVIISWNHPSKLTQFNRSTCRYILVYARIFRKFVVYQEYFERYVFYRIMHNVGPVLLPNRCTRNRDDKDTRINPRKLELKGEGP